MTLQLHAVRKLQFPGAKAVWELKVDDVLTFDGVEYVKLPRAGINFGFTRVVLDGCHTAPNPIPKGFSLTQSRGYSYLMNQRNIAQSDSLVAGTVSKIPDMFKKAAKVKAAKPTKESMAEMKACPGALTINVPSFDHYTEPFVLQVQRPILGRDELAVVLEVGVLQKVIEYIRFEGFDEALKRSPELPAGVYKRARGSAKLPYSYVYKSTNGVKSRHCAATVADAEHGTQNGPAGNVIDGEWSDEEPASGDDDGGCGEFPQ